MPVTGMNRLGVAVVGAGLGSAPHFLALRDLSAEVDILYVCARDAARLAQADVPPGAVRTTRLGDALQDPRVQAVLVLTPPNTHLEIVQQAALAGKHVLVEKPLEIDLDRATALVEACEQAGVQLAVMLQHRLRPASLALADLLRTGSLGELVSALASVRWWRPQGYYDEPGRGTLARDGGGVLITQAIHTLDLMLSLIGLPERVTGVASTSAVHRMEGEDVASALLHYGNHAVAMVQATTAAFPGYAERIELNFTLGSATLEAGALRVVRADGQNLTVGAVEASGGGANPMQFDHGPHRAVIKDFVEAVRLRRPPAVNGRSALGVQQVIAAILDSSRAGFAVPLQAGGNAVPR